MPASNTTDNPSDAPTVPAAVATADAFSAKQLLAASRVQAAVRAALKADRRYGFDKPWDEFLALLRFANPQSYGKRFEARAIEECGVAQAVGLELDDDEQWIAVPSSANRGDARVLADGDDPEDDAAGRWVEMKVSFLLFETDQVNVVQVRPYQDLDGYVIYVVDPANVLYRFDLTAEQMYDEVAATGASLAHGTRGSAEANTNVEYAVRFSFDPTDETCARWLERYLVGTTAADQQD